MESGEKEKELVVWIKEQEEKQRGLVNAALGAQVRAILENAGITGLRVDKSGIITGQTSKLHIYPTTTYLSDIRLVVKGGKIIIDAAATNEHENIGSVI